MSNQSATKKFNFCHTQVRTTTEEFTWTMARFPNHPYLSSKFISTAPNGQLLKWQMIIYPNQGYIWLYLKLYNSNNEEVKARYEISIRKSNGEEFILKPMPEEYLKFEQLKNAKLDDNNNKLIKKEELLDKKNQYLYYNRLTIVCKLEVQQEWVENASLPDIEVPECRAVEDMSRLFEESLLTDCKIISGDDKKEFEVHKCILCCRSPVLKPCSSIKRRPRASIMRSLFRTLGAMSSRKCSAIFIVEKNRILGKWPKNC